MTAVKPNPHSGHTSSFESTSSGPSSSMTAPHREHSVRMLTNLHSPYEPWLRSLREGLKRGVLDR